MEHGVQLRAIASWPSTSAGAYHHLAASRAEYPFLAAVISGAWAKEHGLAVSDRGRIPASVAEQYHAAAGGR